MKNSAIKKACAVLSVVLGASSVSTAVAVLLAAVVVFSAKGQESSQLITSYPFRESFERHYQMGPSPRIEIDMIAGPVVISSGRAGMADVTVWRSAATRWEFDCYQVKIDPRPDLIRIATARLTDRPECRDGLRDSQEIRLRVPPDALVDLSNIAGDLQITGPVRGVKAKAIAGHASIAAAGTVDLQALAKGLSLRLGAASPGTAIIQAVGGGLEIDVANRRNVEIRLDANSLQNEVRVPPDFTRLMTRDGYLLKSGEGGPSLSLHAINGGVVVRRR